MFCDCCVRRERGKREARCQRTREMSRSTPSEIVSLEQLPGESRLPALSCCREKRARRKQKWSPCMLLSFVSARKNHRFSVCDSNIWIGVNPKVVVTPFARRHLWCICAAISVGSPCVVARFARRYLWGICGAVSVGHSAWWLASLVGTYGVFVPRSVLGHSAWWLASLKST